MSQLFITQLNPPLQPRAGNTLRVLIMTRISTEGQDEQSLDDQAALCRSYVKRHYNAPIKFDVIQHRESGERRQRKDLTRARQMIEAGDVDVIVTEDMARIMRHITGSMEFLDACQDHDTRLISINDQVDTATESKLMSFFSSLRHEMYNADTSKRIKRSLDNRFTQGGTLSCQTYGYIKDTGAKTEDGLHKDPAAQAVYDHWFKMLEDGASYSEVADWLNDKHVPTGPISRRNTWDCKMVSRITHNPILKGVRQRGRRITRRLNRTGKHYTVKAPREHLKERHCPHLAFIEPERYDRVITMLDAKNSKYRRGKHGRDPMAGRTKKRTTWPGQSVRCGVCGRPFVWGGHGRTEHLMCSGAKDYHCWNGLSFDGRLAAKKIADAVLNAVQALPDFEPGFRALVEQELAGLTGTIDQQKRELQHKRKDIDARMQNILHFVEKAGESESSVSRQQELMAQKAQIDLELTRLDRAALTRPVLPGIDEIKRMARDLFQNLAVNDPSFARKLRRLIPDIRLLPVRCITGGHALLRARFELRLARLFEGVELLDKVDEHLTLSLNVDLFDPPQPVKLREAVLNFEQRTSPVGKPYTKRQIAEALGVSQPVVQLAVKLHRAMERLGTKDPYEVLAEPPAGSNKMRRHKHPRYRFQPLPGHTLTATGGVTGDADAA
ncbi:MAG: recombinase family protein [Phycisphaerales bacterium]